MAEITGKLSTEIQGGPRSISLQGEDAVATLQSVYPPELAWSLVPEDIDDCRIVMEVPLALEALTTMVDRMHAMRKFGEADRRVRGYDALQATAHRLAAQIYEAWEPPFEVPEAVIITEKAAGNGCVPTQSTATEVSVAQRIRQAAILPVA